MDEFACVFGFGWVEVNEVVEWLALHKPLAMHVIITGWGAPDVLIEAADSVTDMRLVKHPFEEQGIIAQRGIEF